MLLLQEDQYKSLTDNKKVLYLLQWLQNLPQAIKSADKAELKSKEGALIAQLQAQLSASLGPPLRCSLGQAFVALYQSGQAFSLHGTVGRCCDVIKTKDESPGASANKLTALECLGNIYQHHGRMAGSAFPETVQVLVKAMRMQEYRSEILGVLRRLLVGLGLSSSSAHKDVYKCIKNGLGDKAMNARSAASQCALELAQHSTFLYSQELDSISNGCLRALDGSNYEVRCSIAKLLGSLIALTQKPLPPNLKGKVKVPSLDEALSILSNGFVRGASGFLKAGGPELLKSGSASREVRVGVTQTYVVFLGEMGGVWVERHLPVIAKHLLDLVTHPKTISSHIDAVYSRKCVTFILRNVFGRLLGESAQLVAAKHLCSLVSQAISSSLASQKSDNGEKGSEGNSSASAGSTSGGAGLNSGDINSKEKDKDKSSLHQHAVICAILEIGALVYNLNTAALPLVIGEGGGGGVTPTELARKPPPLLEALRYVFVLPHLAARLAGAWCMHCIGLALPSQLSTLVDYSLSQLRRSRGSLEAVSGYSSATAALLGTVRYSELGIPSAKAKDVFSLGQELIASGLKEMESPSLSMNRVQSGWSLIGAYISLGVVHVRPQLRHLLGLWRGAFPHSMKELNSEQASGSLKSWLTNLENRAGALACKLTPYYWPSQNPPTTDHDYALYLVKQVLRSKRRIRLLDYELNNLHKLKLRLAKEWKSITEKADLDVKVFREQKRVAKAIIASQEEAYWRLTRPPPGDSTLGDSLLTRHYTDRPPWQPQDWTLENLELEVAYLQSIVKKRRVHTSTAVQGLVKFCHQYNEFDPMLNQPFPSNPWITGEDSYWVVERSLLEHPLERQVKKWACSFLDLLTDVTGRYNFEKFCRSQFCYENVRFWQSCRDLKSIPYPALEGSVKLIYDEFLQRGSSSEVNVSASVQEEVEKDLKQPSRYAFTAAQEQIFQLMQNDIYPRFLKSKDYQEMMQKGQEMNSVGKGFFSKLKYSNLGVKKTKFEILSMDGKGISPCLPQRYARRHLSISRKLSASAGGSGSLDDLFVMTSGPSVGGKKRYTEALIDAITAPNPNNLLAAHDRLKQRRVSAPVPPKLHSDLSPPLVGVYEEGEVAFQNPLVLDSMMPMSYSADDLQQLMEDDVDNIGPSKWKKFGFAAGMTVSDNPFGAPPSSTKSGGHLAANGGLHSSRSAACELKDQARELLGVPTFGLATSPKTGGFEFESINSRTMGAGSSESLHSTGSVG